MRIPDLLLDECRQMASIVAPETNGRLVVIDAADLQGKTPQALSCILGWAHYGAFNEHLASLVPDYSPGMAVICLDGSRIAENAKAGHFERCLRAVMVHEMAHVVPMRQPKKLSTVTGEQLEQQKSELVELLTMPPPPPRLDYGHDWSFIRRAVHCYARSLAAGFDVAMEVLTDYLPTTNYLPLLLGEVLNWRDRPFIDIEFAAAPPSLREQYQADLEYHERVYDFRSFTIRE